MSSCEKKLRIGVKYCGGCNERYDRMGTFRKIVQDCSPDTEFVPVSGKENEIFDFIIVVSGCQAQCADISKLKSRNGIFGLYQDADPQKAVDRIRELEALLDTK